MTETPHLDPRLIEACRNHQKRLTHLDYVNPVAVSAAASRVFAAADRLLSFETWHDQLERRKRDTGFLPPVVEKNVIEALAQAEADARDLAAGAIDVVRAFARADFFDQALPYACEAMRTVGGIDFGHAFAATRKPVTDMLTERGLRSEHVDLLYRAAAEKSVTWADLKVTPSEDGRGLVLHWRGSPRSSLRAHSLRPLPFLNGDTWINGGAIHLLVNSAAVADKLPRTCPWGLILSLAQALVGAYDQRRKVTEAKGLQVYETGFDWNIIVVIAIILAPIIAPLITLILCSTGTIKNDGVCIFAGIMFLLGVVAGLIGCAASGGKMGMEAGNGGADVTCTKEWGGGADG